jgi:sporulation protein YlmC with PRC-barrel domain
MDLPASADVIAADGACGRLTCLVLDPDRDVVTHLVVAASDFPHTQRLVPIDLLVDASPRTIRLRCNCQDLSSKPGFVETEYIKEEVLHYDGRSLSLLMQPLGISVPTFVRVDHHRIPPGELTVDRGARVEATDGEVGRVDDVVVDPTNGRITQLILRKGHLWGQRDVTIPVENIVRFADNTVYLRLDKHQVGELPAVRRPQG